MKLISWNYQEAGHGKGAPDGIGAVVKRTADNHVRFGGDVATFEDFVQIVQQNVQHVEIIIIPVEEISKRQFPKDLPAFKGTNKVHQALWTSSLPFDVALRSLSCFTCRDSYVPCKHGKHLGVLTVGLLKKNATAMPSSTSNDDDVLMKPMDNDETESIPDSLQNLIHIDSPTIFKNIGDLRQFDSMEMLNSDIVVEDSPKIKILSNIVVNYQSFKKPSRNCPGFSSINQTEFEKFIHQRPKFQDFEDDIDSIRIDNNVSPQVTSNITELADSSYVALDKENIEEIELKYNIDDWVVVEYKIKKNSNYFIGKILNRTQSSLEYKIIFLRKGQGKSTKFGWPVISDDDVVPESRILQRLHEPKESRRGQFVFKDLPNINFK